MRRSAKKKTVTQTVEEYASSTSIHGISYIFDRQPKFKIFFGYKFFHRELNLVDRFLWTVVVLFFLVLATVLTWNTWTQWQDQQVKNLFVNKRFLTLYIYAPYTVLLLHLVS